MTSWVTARDALVALLDGATNTAAGYAAETLKCVKRPPKGAPDTYPFAFVIPPARTVTPMVNGVIKTEISSVKVRVWLTADDIEEAADRMEAWIPTLSAIIGAHVTLGLGNPIITDRHFTEFSSFNAAGEGPPWGFDMELTAHFTDTETRGA